jgi:hypothetical protein
MGGLKRECLAQANDHKQIILLVSLPNCHVMDPSNCIPPAVC